MKTMIYMTEVNGHRFGVLPNEMAILKPDLKFYESSLIRGWGCISSLEAEKIFVKLQLGKVKVCDFKG